MTPTIQQPPLRPLLFFARLPSLDALKALILDHVSYDIAIVIPFSTETRRNTFKHVEAIVRCVYSAVTEDATLFLVSNDDDTAGGAVLQLEDLKNAIAHFKNDVVIVGDKQAMRIQNWPGWNVRYISLGDDLAKYKSSSRDQDIWLMAFGFSSFFQPTP